MQADAAEAELRLEQARHADLERSAAESQGRLAAAQQQTAELLHLNEALSREVEGTRAEQAIAERARADAADQCASVRPDAARWRALCGPRGRACCGGHVSRVPA